MSQINPTNSIKSDYKYQEIKYNENCVIRQSAFYCNYGSQEEKIERILNKLIQCESGGNANAIGDNGLAFGILQYHKETFDLFKKSADMEWLEYENPEHQIILTRWALKNNLGHHWTCYK